VPTEREGAVVAAVAAARRPTGCEPVSET